jgi:hypothetical protein
MYFSPYFLLIVTAAMLDDWCDHQIQYMKEGILRRYLTVEAKVDIISWMLRNSAR